jgi:hypothetical protein
VILAAENVVDLQYFLMDAAKRYVSARGVDATVDDLLANAAALDYALLLSSQHADETIDDDSAAALALRETVARAVGAALDVVERMLDARNDEFDDFVERHVRVGGLFDVIRSLRESGVTPGDDLAFRTVTLANDLIERRRRR